MVLEAALALAERRLSHPSKFKFYISECTMFMVGDMILGRPVIFVCGDMTNTAMSGQRSVICCFREPYDLCSARRYRALVHDALGGSAVAQS